MRFLLIISILAVLVSPLRSQNPLDYADPANWAENGPMGKHVGIDADYTLILPGANIGQVVTVPYDTTSNFHIFCIYPTYPEVDNSPPQTSPFGTHPDTMDPVIRGLFSQFGQFGRIFAPYYRQANFETFRSDTISETLQADLIEIAQQDVIAAFHHYMNCCNNGEKVILVGHSQGAVLLGNMLHRFEADPQSYPGYLDQIFLAVLPGMSGPWVTNGTLSNGWLDDIPVCQDSLDIECIMTWQGYVQGSTMVNSLTTHHVYNDSLAARGYRYAGFDSLQHSVKMDPLRFSNQRGLKRMCFPHNFHYSRMGVSYTGVSTPFIAYENWGTGIYGEVTSGAGIGMDGIGLFDPRKLPLFWTVLWLGPGNMHNFDLLAFSGDVTDLIWLKIQNAVGISERAELKGVKVYDLGEEIHFKVEGNAEPMELTIYGVDGRELIKRGFVGEVRVGNAQFPSQLILFRVLELGSERSYHGKLVPLRGNY